MTNRKSYELLYALAAMVVITLLYLWMNLLQRAVPAASSFYGHSMGVVGFILMLMTEILYSLRKRTRLARWGPMSGWLQFHIFTGIVGPYLVLLHSSWKFNGIAGILTLMTAVIVISGFIGRYIYTAVPRTADGLMLEVEELEGEIAAADAHLQAWAAAREGPFPALAHQLDWQAAAPEAGAGLIFGREIEAAQRRIKRWLADRHMEPGLRAEAQQLEMLLDRRDALQRQAGSLQMARKLLATWHTIHIPIGLGLFALAFVHIAAAIYYSGLLR
ncbi:MAG TPA: hypothetical protein VLH85_04460 [Levilinea sp.]|nr:hypothetical protein [Levilinea sp.]